MLLDSLITVIERSGLMPLWLWASEWLALDARQLIFAAATPVFIGVAVSVFFNLVVQ